MVKRTQKSIKISEEIKQALISAQRHLFIEHCEWDNAMDEKMKMRRRATLEQLEGVLNKYWGGKQDKMSEINWKFVAEYLLIQRNIECKSEYKYEWDMKEVLKRLDLNE